MTFKKEYEQILITALRVILAIIFIWFGALKMLGYNPVEELILGSLTPFLAHGAGLFVLGAAETFIGIMLLVNRAIFVTHTLLVLHLLGTFSTLLFGWNVIFDPYFPILSLDGEFVIKNLILVISGLLVLVHEARKRQKN